MSKLQNSTIQLLSMNNILLISLLLLSQIVQAQDVAYSDRSIYLEDNSIGKLSDMLGDDRCLLITCSTQAPACKEYIMYLNEFKEKNNADFRAILLVETSNRRLTDGTREYYAEQNLNVELAFATGQRQVTPNLGNFKPYNKILEAGIQIDQYLITEDITKTEALLSRFFINKEYVDIPNIRKGIHFQDSIRNAKILARKQNDERARKKPTPKPTYVRESDIKLIPPSSKFTTKNGETTTLEPYLTSEYTLIVMWQGGIGGKQINDVDKFSKLHSFNYVSVFIGNESGYNNFLPKNTAKNNWDFISLHDLSGQVFKELPPNKNALSWPQMFIIDREGTVIKSTLGYHKPDWAAEIIAKFPPKKI